LIVFVATWCVAAIIIVFMAIIIIIIIIIMVIVDMESTSGTVESSECSD
jgi:hypothetical protein